jgi:acyl-CoA synthetase (AMP-forming)/AMP-acid ligase II
MPTNDPTIAWVLDRAANINPHGAATVDLGTGERRDWAEVARRVAGLAAGLNGLSLDRGDRVGVLMLNSARHLELWFAIPVAAMVMNDLNFRLAPEELRFICDDSQVKVLFVDETFLPVARQLRDKVASIETLVWVGPGTEAPHGTIAYESMVDTPPIELPELESQDVAAIFYTGGTTGLPRAPSSRTATSQQTHYTWRCTRASPPSTVTSMLRHSSTSLTAHLRTRSPGLVGRTCSFRPLTPQRPSLRSLTNAARWCCSCPP